MHNKVGFNRLNRKSSHRKALHRNMMISLFRYEKIKTTVAKAKEIRRSAEKVLSRAKVDSVHNRRKLAELIHDKEILNKLFVELGPRFKERKGGYTRVLKLGWRKHDAAEMALLELVGSGLDERESSQELEVEAKEKKKTKA